MSAARKYQLPDNLRRALRGEVRKRIDDGATQRSIADKMGVTQQSVSKMLQETAGLEIAEKFLGAFDLSKEIVLRRLERGDYETLINIVNATRASAARGSGISRDLTDERRQALEAEEWDGNMPEEYEFVHEAIASHRLNLPGGGEPVASFWRSRIKALRAEFRGKRIREVVQGDPNAPDSKVEAEKAARKAKRVGR